MSIIFGVVNEEDRDVTEPELRQLAIATDRFARDGLFVKVNRNAGMGFQPYHTHKRSRLEHLPRIDPFGDMVVFDGRLDNHAELSNLLDIHDRAAADSEIVLLAFRRWGEDSFARFVGDWALAVWSRRDRALYLARDHAGTRTLYFEIVRGRVLFSTYLETFFAIPGQRNLSASYAVSYLSGSLVPGLTPYSGVLSVAAGNYVAVENGKVRNKRHWVWLSNARITQQRDDYYEEQFVSLFRIAVARRIEGVAEAVAELSGGIDSSSIVCMADAISRSTSGATGVIDTLSYVNTLEKENDDHLFVRLIEERRHKTGTHVDTATTLRAFTASCLCEYPYRLPGGDSSSILYEEQLKRVCEKHGYRVIISGVGGDELLGGVPNPFPELGDYLRSVAIGLFFSQTFQWSLTRREPLLQTVVDTTKFVRDVYTTHSTRKSYHPSWLRQTAIDYFERPSEDAESAHFVLHYLPSAIHNGRVWELLVLSLPHLFPTSLSRYEYRYPYLDRDLVEFLLRIPRSQIIRSTERRSLMRRGLRHIVPNQILERKRKAFSYRRPLLELRSAQPQIETLFRHSLLAELGLIDAAKFLAEFRLALIGKLDHSWSHIRRSIAMELWLQETNRNIPTLQDSVPPNLSDWAIRSRNQ